MTSRPKTLLRLTVAAAALLLPLSGCSSPTAAPSGPAGSAPASSAPAAKTLDFALVEQKTAPTFAKDPNCAFGQWDENSTGVEEEFRSAVKFFRQFDCYKSKEGAGGLPDRLQQSIFVEFSDEATAKKYAASEQALYPSLVDGARVVVAGTGLEAVEMKTYLADLKAACGCGEVLEAGA